MLETCSVGLQSFHYVMGAVVNQRRLVYIFFFFLVVFLGRGVAVGVLNKQKVFHLKIHNSL